MPERPVPGPRPRRLTRDLLGVATLAVAVAAAAGGCTHRGPVVPHARLYQDSLTSPLEVRSVNGVLSATLDVTMADLPVTRAGRAVGDSTVNTHTLSTDTLPLRAYTLAATTDPAYRPNDPRFTPRFPGPTFRVRPGDLVQIWLRNKLPPPTSPSDSNHVCMSYPATDSARHRPPSPLRDVFQDCFHGPNYTNIHYHGMHVTPDSNSTVVGDDVLMVIAPGDSILYSFRVPMNQSPGTHWYHPHKHGSVAIQVANGMSGAFIVEDPATGVDRFTRHHNLREHLIAFQQIDTTLGLLHGDRTNILDKVPPLVNGQNFPTLYMAPGEVQRWRIVNENVTRNSKTLEFRFEDRPGDEPVVVEVARDGVQFAPANLAAGNDSVLLMGAGNRLDLIVQAPPRTGTHHFRVRHNPGSGRRTRRPVLPRRTRASAGDPQFTDSTAYLLFRVVVDPARKASSTGIPASMPNLAAYLGTAIPAPPAFIATNLTPARDTAVVVFTDAWHPGNDTTPTQFFLGSAPSPRQRFNDTVVFVPSNARGTSMPMVLDSTQTWKIVNHSVNQINHPFHIHINPFQVDSVHAPNAQDAFLPLYQELNAAARRGSPIWLDVLPLPSPTVDSTGAIVDSAYVFITQRYASFEGCKDGKCGPPTGHFVMHCHILGHEERGMMQVLQVVRPGERPSNPGGHGAPRPAAHTGGGRGQRRPDAQPAHRH
ncbi:MAG TPA: multicopper oxidase domain-containing protein [Longimicrobium sp.]